jgi:thiamine-monophosphate kinase
VTALTVADRTEAELIARIHAHFQAPPPWVVVGIGDDAAVVEPERNRLEVISVDALVDGVHFDRRFTPPDAIGHRALAVNLSDLAAMGAQPRLAVLSLALPRTWPLPDFDEFAAGFGRLATLHRLQVVGGNLTHTPGPLVIDVTVAGTVKRRGVLTRRGARPGDELYVSGTIGSAAAGLCALQQGDCRPALASGIERYLRPEPRVRLGLLLGRNRAASACIDLSDGLADGAHQLARASGLGLLIDADAIPIEPGARDWFERERLDPVTAAVTRGDDYELLFTVRPRFRGRLRTATAGSDVPVTRIGVCTADPGVVLRRMRDGQAVAEPMPLGYGHFR